MKSKKKKTRGERRKILHQNLVAYSFLAPSLIGVICFSLIPLIISLYVSLTDWNFIGLTNFINLWKDEWFLASLKNTLIFTVVTVPIGLFLAIYNGGTD
jgi:multiple sugar transport system permease protein